MEERESTRFAFKIDDQLYSSDWVADNVTTDESGTVHEGPGKEFAEAYTDLWQEKLGELGDLIEDETDFEWADQDEAGVKYHGTGFYSRFRLWMPHLPTEPRQVRIYYMKQEHIGNADEVREELEDLVDKGGA